MERGEAIKILMGYNYTPEERAALETLIPELTESEDEKIRRTLVEYFGPSAQLDFIRGVPIKKIRDWLEKQKEPHYTKRNALFDKCVENCDPKVMKEVSDNVDEMLGKEQKPAEWSKNDTVFLNEITDFFENKTVKLQHDLDMYAHWLKSLPERFNLQPKKEWSKLDEEMRQGCIDSVEYELLDNGKDDEVKTDPRIVWLKSLRPQPSWKPSEEQMKALIDCTIGNEYDVHALVRLWAELKKL